MASAWEIIFGEPPEYQQNTGTGESGSWWDTFRDSLGSLGDNAADYLSSGDGITNLGALGLSYIANQMGWNDPNILHTGYQGGIPELSAVRRQVPVAQSASGAPMAYDPNRRPGSGGRRYFTDVEYTPKADNQAPAQQRQDEQVAELMQQTINNPARQERAPVQQMAEGGLAAIKKPGRYLKGDTDGMADEIPAEIEGEQPAALSDGEFVIPADVVSHLGNGNSEAGAKVLQEMMARIRKERTGSKEQGKEIEPNKILPR
jgi:hypothetical protein